MPPSRSRTLAIAAAAAALAFIPVLAFARGKHKSANANTDNPAYAAVTVDLAPNLTGRPPAPVFIHPGVLVNRRQLEEIKRRVAAGIEPQKSAFEALKSSPYGARDYKAQPWAGVECGPYSNPDLGCKAEQRDSEAAYGQALLWAITGDPVYGRNAVAIMNAWADMLKKGHTNANGPVQAAWCAEVWPRAAEIMRYTSNFWSDADVVKFQNLLRTQYLPSLIHGCTENGNKELSMAEALINIGVFDDDRKVYDLGVKMWRGRAPAYIYLTSDGPEPIKPVGCTAIWSNKGEMPPLVDGILQETARDSEHPALALAAMVNACETARQQGLDLYAEQGKRIRAALEFQAQYLPPNHAQPPDDLEFKTHPTWEIAYNEYHNRLGYSLPLIDAVLKRIRPTGVDHDMCWETLTHADMGSVGLPPITAQ